MSQTISITVIERAAKGGQWRFERASLQSPEKAIRSWIEKAAKTAPIEHTLGSELYAPETRTRPPIRARRCRVILPDCQKHPLLRRLVMAIVELLTDLLRLMFLRPRRAVYAKPYPSRSRRR